MKKNLIKLFANGYFLHVALVVAIGPFVYWKLDERFGMILVGLLFSLHGLANYEEAKTENTHFDDADASFIGAKRPGCMSYIEKANYIFFIFFGLFIILVTLIMFMRGERISVSG